MSANTYQARGPAAFFNSAANCFCRSTHSTARSGFTRYSVTTRISPTWPQADAAILIAATAVNRNFMVKLLPIAGLPTGGLPAPQVYTLRCVALTLFDKNL